MNKEVKGEHIYYRGEFQNNVENKLNAEFSSRI